ncbi:MAG: T9SS type A sorting domain-containing protein [Mucilaginibacter sp.]
MTNVTKPQIIINCGDGYNDTLYLNGTASSNKTLIIKYSGNHTYASDGIYDLTYQDTFRIAGIKNIKNSQTQRVFLTTELRINSTIGPNTTPFLLWPPDDLILNGNTVYYDPGFYDTDGDSLSVPGLIPCSINNVNDYYFPTGTTLNSKGVLSFSKDSLATYAFSYQIFEWRKDQTNTPVVIGWSAIDIVMEITTDIGVREYFDTERIINIYPNPASNTLNIVSKRGDFTGNELEILNSIGQVVIKAQLQSSIDISNLATGIYTLRIVSAEKVLCTKFSKQ